MTSSTSVNEVERSSSVSAERPAILGATSGGVIRALEAADIPAVAGIYERVFLSRSAADRSNLTLLLQQQFMPDSVSRGSLIYVRDGEVAGFAGAIPMTLSIEGRTASAAVLASLMVDNHSLDPLAGAKLIRAMVSGPQDITLSETANKTSVAMWRGLHGTVLPSYSLDWQKVLQPASYIAARVANRLTLARVVKPAARALDLLVAAHPTGPQQWRPFIAERTRSTSSVDTTLEAASELILDLVSHYDARPVWTVASLRQRLQMAKAKPRFGDLTCRTVMGRGGKPVGIFLYHGRRDDLGHVLQVLARPGQLGAVLDELFHHAASTGIAALRGRADPGMLDALLGRDCSFTNVASMVAIARDQSLLNPLIAGRALITGLAGESWSPLVGSIG